jgi:hypothetical protein
VIALAAISALLTVVPTGFTESVERVELVATSKDKPQVVVDALGKKVLLQNAKISPKTRSELCPTVELTRDAVILHCTTRRLWAEVVEDDHGAPSLDLRSLRGVAWKGDVAMSVRAWPLRVAGIPDECPGRIDAAKGECALAAGKFDEAERHFKLARGGPDSAISYLRLGDLALQRGDAETAVHLYAFVSPVGPVGRLARARQCELTGSCLEPASSKSAGDTQGLADAPRAELALMYWRREVFMDREAAVMPAFSEALRDDPSLCSGALALCQRLLQVGLASADEATRVAALGGWLAESVRHGPYELEVAAAAAVAAESLGAPGFAATVLAGVSSQVEKVDLPGHLLRVIQLYLAARDAVRAAVILDYAESRLGRAATSASQWQAVRTRLRGRVVADAGIAKATKEPPSLESLQTTVSLAADLARAAAVRSRAQEPAHE